MIVEERIQWVLVRANVSLRAPYLYKMSFYSSENTAATKRPSLLLDKRSDLQDANELTDEQMEAIVADLAKGLQLDHPNIIRCYKAWQDRERRCINFITEFFTSGNLRDFRQRHQHLEVSLFLFHLAFGLLHYCCPAFDPSWPMPFILSIDTAAFCPYYTVVSLHG